MSICGAGIACATIIGFWRSAFVQCGIRPSYVQYGICPLGMGAVVVYLILLTVAAAALAMAAVAGSFPRIASISGAALVAGAFLFPYVTAFADLGIGASNPGVVLGGLLALGGASGFIQTVPQRKGRRLPTESYNWLTMGGTLIAFTGSVAYWLPQNLSSSSICSGGTGGLGCLPSPSPLIPMFFSLGLTVLGIGVASPVLLDRWPEIGFSCTALSGIAAYLAFIDPNLLLVALPLGLGSIFGFVGVIPRMVRPHGAERPPSGWPSVPDRRGSP